MIPDYYCDDPFPINIETETLAECYLALKEDFTPADFFEIVSGGNVELIMNFLEDMICFYMEQNLSDGCFCIVRDAKSLLNKFQNRGIEREILQEFKLDLSHMEGMGRSEMQILILPFKNIDDMEYFGYMFRKRKLIDFWMDGERLGNNMGL